MIEVLGWVGGALLALCGLPQAIKSWKDGHSDGISDSFLWMWFIGEVFLLIYILFKHGLDLPLVANYLINLFFIVIIIKYKYKPRKEE
jgi:uncharacterized protein with PQ loop repeat